MKPVHHPEPDELAQYASGASPDHLSLVIACHLTYCAECRDEVKLLEELGGALLDSLPGGDGEMAPPEDLPPPAAREKRERAPLPPEFRMIPRPIHAFLDGPPRFRFLAPGVKHVPLALTVGRIQAKVVRFSPGFVVPEHSHQGLEMVLVLEGELTDGATKEVFRNGDLSRREEGSRHTQHITSEDPCVCLVVSTAEIVPSTFWGKVLKALTGV
ncbi:MAG TPA: cupin domain-containing protein [Polyangiaceae bacterium]|nr:cupin domain-containing protein [Polyangiaceae bacterium]